MMSTETEAKTKPKSEIQFNFNEKTLEAFTKEGLDLPHDVRFEMEMISKFKAKANPPIQIIIKTMNRRSVVTYDKDGKAIRKEYLTYRAEYHSKDWLGNDIWIRTHLHGHFKKPKIRSIMEMNYETGEHIPRKELNGSTDEYYIELTDKNRKQIIEDIINNSNGTIIDEILFYGHFTNSRLGPSFRCDKYTYDQFINSSMEELERLGCKEGGPQGNAPRPTKDVKGYHG